MFTKKQIADFLQILKNKYDDKPIPSGISLTETVRAYFDFQHPGTFIDHAIEKGYIKHQKSENCYKITNQGYHLIKIQKFKNFIENNRTLIFIILSIITITLTILFSC